MNDIGLIFTLVTIFTILFIGLVTFLHRRKSVTNKLFLFISFITAAWSISNYFSLQPVIFSELIWARLVMFFAIPHIVFFYLFIKNFPKENFSIPKKEIIYLSLVGGLLMVLTLTSLVFEKMTFINGIPTPTPGILIPIFGLFIIFVLISSIVLIIKKYIKGTKKVKVAWRSMFIGFVSSYVLIILTNFVFLNATGDTRFVLFAPLFMLPSIIGTAYSIMKYKLFNVKAMATEVILFVLLSITLIQTILSRNSTQLIFNLVILISLLVVGFFLIKSVYREVKQRKSLEKLRLKLEDSNIKLEEANDKLKDLDKLKTEFLSLASHQLRSPLTAIKGYTSMLIEGDYGDINEKAEETIHRIFESSNNLTMVVEDLLNVSKIEQGGMKYEMKNFDLGEIVENTEKDLSITAKKKGLKLSYKTDDKDKHIVYGDKEKLRQVIINLIDNSIKYTKKGSIMVSVINEGKNVVFAVKDTGMGINPEIKEKLFQKFSRGNGGKINTTGSGLGLYLVKKVVEAHKGKVWVESDGENLGSTFFMQLERA
ncbi:MAG: ATP-binding protein [Patescibacteria group bacterium]|nr:ATP-binding protein [Patescibacteria group bacterium]